MNVKKMLSLVLAMSMTVLSLSFAVAALDENAIAVDTTVDYFNVDSSAISEISPLAAKTYDVYSDKWYVMQGMVGVGCEGWTNLIDKKSSDPIYHYTNACAWVGDPYYSGREWGTGKVYASTGNIGMGAISAISIYYGIS